MARSETYTRLRARIAEFPVVDCHEHASGPHAADENREPIAALITGYVQSDLMTAVYPGWPDARPDMWEYLNDHKVPTEEKWPLFERIWRATEHTAYARITRLILRDVYGEPAMSLAALQRIRGRLLDLHDPAVYRRVLDEAHIVCRITNNWPNLRNYLNGSYHVYELNHFMVPLPGFHQLHNRGAIDNIAQLAGATVTNLDDYVAVCGDIFQRMKARGAIGMKDQSAYERTIAIGNPTRAEAEAVFNRLLADPRTTIGWPECQPLEDYLFQRFMECARRLDWPVQIHTGHMAGIRNEVAKTNAVLLTPLLELHRDVRFDLFHGNWPYMGEALFLAKNYPNVRLDLCWLHAIDPVYARRMLSEALVALPHSKIHGFGGDYFDDILHAVAHLSLAKDVIAEALAERVEAEWIDEDDALQVAADWLFNNANEYFKLGFETYVP